MVTTALERTHQPEKDMVFVAMPFGTKPLNGVDGPTCNFDTVFAIIAGILETMGIRAERLDAVYGPTGMIDLVWLSTQRAGIVIFDLTGKNHNVTLELGLALAIGKKIIMITQNLEDVPTDYRGHRVLKYSLQYEDVEELKKSLTEQIKATLEEPSQEKGLYPLPGAGRVDTMPGTVIQVDKEYVLVQMDDPHRPPVAMTNLDVDYTRRIKDMSRLFKVGQRVDGAFVMDTTHNIAKYTKLAGQDDPWRPLQKAFPVGMVFTGTVTKVIDKVGPFVAMNFGIEGLLPVKTISGLIPPAGSQVEVRVVDVDVVNRKVSLRLNQVLTAASSHTKSDADLPAVGTRAYGRVVKAMPLKNGRGGFVLLTMAGRERPAMLLCKDMSNDLNTDLANGHVEDGEEIYVEVIKVDAIHDKVLLRELPDPELGPDTDTNQVA
ncbi:S1 RNA-binding domain-containing protein [Lentzea kentuckyensis]|uniref:S1 RNA-binding domain-containing protein n=1 Tax=Lentzea kentuckyensis TaxID=360086 RepID=UPI000A373980|nr:S1 RNA-binding domain-containing protein [Lentzea kentuckyensis]